MKPYNQHELLNVYVNHHYIEMLLDIDHIHKVVHQDDHVYVLQVYMVQ